LRHNRAIASRDRPGDEVRAARENCPATVLHIGPPAGMPMAPERKKMVAGKDSGRSTD
jgi:hypothetical protein